MYAAWTRIEWQLGSHKLEWGLDVPQAVCAGAALLVLLEEEAETTSTGQSRWWLKWKCGIGENTLFLILSIGAGDPADDDAVVSEWGIGKLLNLTDRFTAT